MPRVSQVSTIETPGADSGTPACRTVASGPGSPSTAHVEHDAGDRRLRAEHLAAGEQVAALDLGRDRGRRDPVGAAAGRHDQPVGDLGQHAVGVGGAAAPPEALHQRQVVVHRRRRARPRRSACRARAGRAPAGASWRRRRRGRSARRAGGSRPRASRRTPRSRTSRRGRGRRRARRRPGPSRRRAPRSSESDRVWGAAVEKCHGPQVGRPTGVRTSSETEPTGR